MGPATPPRAGPDASCPPECRIDTSTTVTQPSPSRSAAASYSASPAQWPSDRRSAARSFSAPITAVAANATVTTPIPQSLLSNTSTSVTEARQEFDEIARVDDPVSTGRGDVAGAACLGTGTPH